jgi:hypothetical protein
VFGLGGSSRGGRRSRLVVVLAALALVGAFSEPAYGYVFDVFFSGTVPSGGHQTHIEGTARFYLFGEIVGPVGQYTCFVWHSGRGTCSTSNTSYIYATGENVTQNAYCDLFGRGSSVTCRSAY